MGSEASVAPEVGVARIFRGLFAPILLENPLFNFLATPLVCVCVCTGARVYVCVCPYMRVCVCVCASMMCVCDMRGYVSSERCVHCTL